MLHHFKANNKSVWEKQLKIIQFKKYYKVIYISLIKCLKYVKKHNQVPFVSSYSNKILRCSITSSFTIVQHCKYILGQGMLTLRNLQQIQHLQVVPMLCGCTSFSSLGPIGGNATSVLMLVGLLRINNLLMFY